ncbi:hypothetical protein APS_2475 [Acetobacter pasteurianus subsp. pasteurianus LMG 1262 = NBRC 106471]|nr:hypothetical protein APS_2475 [Acetobacter pasteurianus subsp. pasteurianus LMG 1262 = NBRC 106471]
MRQEQFHSSWLVPGVGGCGMLFAKCATFFCSRKRSVKSLIKTAG